MGLSVVVRWRRVLMDAPIDPTARFAGLILAEYMAADGVGQPSRERIARGMGCSVKTVTRAIRTLECAGLLVVRRDVGRARTNAYRAVLNRDTADPFTTFEIGKFGAVKGDTGDPQVRKKEELRARARVRARDNGAPRVVPDDVLIAAKNAEAAAFLRAQRKGETP